jgi:hypothetical protein
MVEHQRQSDNTRFNAKAVGQRTEGARKEHAFRTQPRRTNRSFFVFEKPRGCSEVDPSTLLPDSTEITISDVLIEGMDQPIFDVAMRRVRVLAIA